MQSIFVGISVIINVLVRFAINCSVVNASGRLCFVGFMSYFINFIVTTDNRLN